MEESGGTEEQTYAPMDYLVKLNADVSVQLGATTVGSPPRTSTNFESEEGGEEEEEAVVAESKPEEGVQPIQPYPADQLGELGEDEEKYEHSTLLLNGIRKFLVC